MHMADALISPAVGGTLWAASAVVSGISIVKVQRSLDQKKVPLMGVMGALVFASQMINFTIPGTGSSGHIGGGLLLALILGPYAGFLTITTILIIQALLFADGGLLALGCNMINLGFFSCFVAYPLVYKPLAGKDIGTKRLFPAALLAAVAGLQMGAFGVVLETLLSGKTELPFTTFALFMQPVHLAIGIIEGLITAAVAVYLYKAKPEIIEKAVRDETIGSIRIKGVLITLAVVAVLTGGVITWFASTRPDGLEWSLFKITGKEALTMPSNPLFEKLSGLQNNTAVLPDYDFKSASNEKQVEKAAPGQWPTVSAGKTLSGLIGGILTLILTIIVAFVIYWFKRKKKV